MKLLYSFGIFITFALQFYVPAEILVPRAVAHVSERWETAVDLLLRTGLVFFTCECESVSEEAKDEKVPLQFDVLGRKLLGAPFKICSIAALT